MLQEQGMPDVIPPVLRHRRFAERQLEPRGPAIRERIIERLQALP